jgi:hypothetical protein
MGRFFFTVLLYLIYSTAHGHLLVLEVESLNDTLEHAADVTHIGCRGFEDQCVLLHGENFLYDEYNYFKGYLPQSKVVNMSLGFQRPRPQAGHHEYFSDGPSFAEQLDHYNERTEVFKEMINSHPQSLFVAAAGNGFNLGIFWSLGVPLSPTYAVFPALYQKPNLVKVASINAPSLDWEQLETYELTDYSNFSLNHVELAAPVEPNAQGEPLSGTSFAAPYVSRIAFELMSLYPELSPEQLIEILIKSSYVINIDRAIEVSLDQVVNGELSMVTRLESARNKRDRDAILQEIGPILLVKSGGPLLTEVARQCAANYFQSTPPSINSACLDAQNSLLGLSEQRAEKLQRLWNLREL